MKALFLLSILVIQLFGITLNLRAKELPIYGEVEIDNEENIFLKTDIFKIGKKIGLLIYFTFENFKDYPTVKIDYCFSDKNEDYTCLQEYTSYIDFFPSEQKPEKTTIIYSNLKIHLY